MQRWLQSRTWLLTNHNSDDYSVHKVYHKPVYYMPSASLMKVEMLHAGTELSSEDLKVSYKVEIESDIILTAQLDEQDCHLP